MFVPLPIRITLGVIGLLSLFWLPWPVSLGCMFLAALTFPPAAIALGIVSDLIYYPGYGFLWGTACGLILCLLATAVRHFVKTRII